MSDETSLSSHAIVEWLTGTIRARLDALTAPLRGRFTDVEIHSYSGPVGSLTGFQAHEVGVEATLRSGDCVALCVTAAYLATTPRVFGDVCWGAPTVTSEASTYANWRSSSDWPLASADSLERLAEELPRLVDGSADTRPPARLALPAPIRLLAPATTPMA